MDIPSSGVQKYLLAMSDFSKGMQNDINRYVARDRLNNTNFRQRIDPIAKKIFRRQNPLELVFQGISTIDAQNPILGSLLRELDTGKKDLASELTKKASKLGVDLDIQKRIQALRKDNRKFENNNNNGPPLPPLSPPTFNTFIPPSPSPLPPEFN